MKTTPKIVLIIFLLLGAVALVALFFHSANIAVLNPQGVIAEQQRDLMLIVTLLMLVVVLPVFILTAFISWKYREGNTKAVYRPEWDHDTKLEAVWWGVPSLIILVISGIIWTSSHELDPYKALASSKEPVTIRVVALQWKWLFIYPEQNIATVNYVYFPKDTPVNFEITADAPMNSFWIPSLGGQVYAMAGMQTKLHLMAEERGTFRGVSANLSGEGFSGMHFIAEAGTQSEFETWVQVAQQSQNHMNWYAYQDLAEPSKDVPPAVYALKEDSLYGTIMEKYMVPDTAVPQLKKERVEATMPAHEYEDRMGHGLQ